MLIYIFRAFGIAVVLKILGTKYEFKNNKRNPTFIAVTVVPTGHENWDFTAQRLQSTETAMHGDLLHRNCKAQRLQCTKTYCTETAVHGDLLHRDLLHRNCNARRLTEQRLTAQKLQCTETYCTRLQCTET